MARSAKHNENSLSYTLKCLFLTLGAGLFISFMLAAPTTGSDPVHYSRYESVEIQASDTLWKIIEENTPAQEDGHTYLKHVVFLNGIQTDQKLHAGAYLLLPRV